MNSLLAKHKKLTATERGAIITGIFAVIAAGVIFFGSKYSGYLNRAYLQLGGRASKIEFQVSTHIAAKGYCDTRLMTIEDIVFVYTRWYLLEPQVAYEYRCRILDGSRSQVLLQTETFTPDKDTFNTSTWYRVKNKDDNSGTWEVRVNLESR